MLVEVGQALRMLGALDEVDFEYYTGPLDVNYSTDGLLTGDWPGILLAAEKIAARDAAAPGVLEQARDAVDAAVDESVLENMLKTSHPVGKSDSRAGAVAALRTVIRLWRAAGYPDDGPRIVSKQPEHSSAYRWMARMGRGAPRLAAEMLLVMEVITRRDFAYFVEDDGSAYRRFGGVLAPGGPGSLLEDERAAFAAAGRRVDAAVQQARAAADAALRALREQIRGRLPGADEATLDELEGVISYWRTQRYPGRVMIPGSANPRWIQHGELPRSQPAVAEVLLVAGARAEEAFARWFRGADVRAAPAAPAVAVPPGHQAGVVPQRRRAPRGGEAGRPAKRRRAAGGGGGAGEGALGGGEAVLRVVTAVAVPRVPPVPSAPHRLGRLLWDEHAAAAVPGAAEEGTAGYRAWTAAQTRVDLALDRLEDQLARMHPVTTTAQGRKAAAKQARTIVGLWREYGYQALTAAHFREGRSRQAWEWAQSRADRPLMLAQVLWVTGTISDGMLALYAGASRPPAGPGAGGLGAGGLGGRLEAERAAYDTALAAGREDAGQDRAVREAQAGTDAALTGLDRKVSRVPQEQEAFVKAMGKLVGWWREQEYPPEVEVPSRGQPRDWLDGRGPGLLLEVGQALRLIGAIDAADFEYYTGPADEDRSAAGLLTPGWPGVLLAAEKAAGQAALAAAGGPNAAFAQEAWQRSEDAVGAALADPALESLLSGIYPDKKQNPFIAAVLRKVIPAWREDGYPDQFTRASLLKIDRRADRWVKGTREAPRLAAEVLLVTGTITRRDFTYLIGDDGRAVARFGGVLVPGGLGSLLEDERVAFARLRQAGGEDSGLTAARGAVDVIVEGLGAQSAVSAMREIVRSWRAQGYPLGVRIPDGPTHKWAANRVAPRSRAVVDAFLVTGVVEERQFARLVAEPTPGAAQLPGGAPGPGTVAAHPGPRVAGDLGLGWVADYPELGSAGGLVRQVLAVNAESRREFERGRPAALDRFRAQWDVLAQSRFVVPVAPDGDCFFRALLAMVPDHMRVVVGGLPSVQQMREEVAGELRRNFVAYRSGGAAAEELAGRGDYAAAIPDLDRGEAALHTLDAAAEMAFVEQKVAQIREPGFWNAHLGDVIVHIVAKLWQPPLTVVCRETMGWQVLGPSSGVYLLRGWGHYGGLVLPGRPDDPVVPVLPGWDSRSRGGIDPVVLAEQFTAALADLNGLAAGASGRVAGGRRAGLLDRLAELHASAVSADEAAGVAARAGDRAGLTAQVARMSELYRSLAGVLADARAGQAVGPEQVLPGAADQVTGGLGGPEAVVSAVDAVAVAEEAEDAEGKGEGVVPGWLYRDLAVCLREAEAAGRGGVALPAGTGRRWGVLALASVLGAVGERRWDGWAAIEEWNQLVGLGLSMLAGDQGLEWAQGGYVVLPAAADDGWAQGQVFETEFAVGGYAGEPPGDLTGLVLVMQGVEGVRVRGLAGVREDAVVFPDGEWLEVAGRDEQRSPGGRLTVTIRAAAEPDQDERDQDEPDQGGLLDDGWGDTGAGSHADDLDGLAAAGGVGGMRPAGRAGRPVRWPDQVLPGGVPAVLSAGYVGEMAAAAEAKAAQAAGGAGAGVVVPGWLYRQLEAGMVAGNQEVALRAGVGRERAAAALAAVLGEVRADGGAGLPRGTGWNALVGDGLRVLGGEWVARAWVRELPTARAAGAEGVVLFEDAVAGYAGEPPEGVAEQVHVISGVPAMRAGGLPGRRRTPWCSRRGRGCRSTMRGTWTGSGGFPSGARLRRAGRRSARQRARWWRGGVPRCSSCRRAGSSIRSGSLCSCWRTRRSSCTATAAGCRPRLRACWRGSRRGSRGSVSIRGRPGSGWDWAGRRGIRERPRRGRPGIVCLVLLARCPAASPVAGAAGAGDRRIGE